MKTLFNTTTIKKPIRFGLRKTVVHFTMLSSMHNDVIGEFEEHATSRAMWDILKLKFGGTFANQIAWPEYQV